MISNCLRDFLATWHEWATGDAVEDKPFWRGYGLCSNLRWRFDEGYDVEQVKDAIFEMAGILEKEFEGSDTPFGDDYYERGEANTIHECPIRLAWVEKTLESCGVVPRPKQYRGWKLGWDYGEWWATHDNYEAEIDGEGDWQGNGWIVSARTLVGLREEIDAQLEEAK